MKPIRGLPILIADRDGPVIGHITVVATRARPTDEALRRIATAYQLEAPIDFDALERGDHFLHVLELDEGSYDVGAVASDAVGGRRFDKLPFDPTGETIPSWRWPA